MKKHISGDISEANVEETPQVEYQPLATNLRSESQVCNYNTIPTKSSNNSPMNRRMSSMPITSDPRLQAAIACVKNDAEMEEGKHYKFEAMATFLLPNCPVTR